jgi:REP element-mobilizing transposase RayT
MKRLTTGEQVWHVFDRAVRRLNLFYDDFDYLKFLALLRDACLASGCVLYAYCLMSNHYHLMVRATSAQLTQCMWLLNRKYALHHNERHTLGGHVFEGPYKAFLQKTLGSVFWRLAYVFLNPVMAELADRPEDYRWSGFLSFMGLKGSPLPVSMPKDLDFHFGSVSKARDHLLWIIEEQRRNGKKSKKGPSALEIQQDQFEALLRLAEARKGSWANEDAYRVAMYWAHRCGIPPRAMGLGLGKEKLKQVRHSIETFEKRVRRDPELARKVDLP